MTDRDTDEDSMRDEVWWALMLCVFFFVLALVGFFTIRP